MRGHGAVNSRFAMEVIVDELAEKAGIDRSSSGCGPAPAETKTVNEFRISRTARARGSSRLRGLRWDEKFGSCRRARNRRRVRFLHLGSALPIHFTKLPQSTAHLKIDMDGASPCTAWRPRSARGPTRCSRNASRAPRHRLERVRVFSQDSTPTRRSGLVRSRVTSWPATAARRAAEEIRAQLIAAARAPDGPPGRGVRRPRGKDRVRAKPVRGRHVHGGARRALAARGAHRARRLRAAPPMAGIQRAPPRAVADLLVPGVRRARASPDRPRPPRAYAWNELGRRQPAAAPLNFPPIAARPRKRARDERPEPASASASASIT